MTGEPGVRMTRAQTWAIVTACAVALSAGGAGWIRHQSRVTREAKFAELAGIGRLKADAIAAWRAERRGDAGVLMRDAALGESVARWLDQRRPEDEASLRSRFAAWRDHYGYDDVLLVDPGGRTTLSLSGRSGWHHASSNAVVEAMRDRTSGFIDLHTEEGRPDPHLGVIAPVFAGDRPAASPAGALILVTNAREYLYPLIQSWPVPRETAETLLVRRDGTDALFLNDLRFHPRAALSLRVPLSSAEVPAVQAILGREGRFEGEDYRGVPVLADLRQVHGSPWFIVAKVDRSEILAPLRAQIAATLLAVAGPSCSPAWEPACSTRRRARAPIAASTRPRRSGGALSRSCGRHCTASATPSSSPTARAASGSMNPVAERLTGWSEGEASGRPLAEIFRIVNEETRRPVEDPAARVIREGIVVGLANHTLLISRDGVESPIADSGAPVRDENGVLTGVVMVFRDQTAERDAERERVLLANTIRASMDEIYLFDADTLRFRFVNHGALHNLGYTLDEATRLTPLDLKPEFTAERFAALAEPLRTGAKTVQVFETIHRRRDGSHYPRRGAPAALRAPRRPGLPRGHPGHHRTQAHRRRAPPPQPVTAHHQRVQPGAGQGDGRGTAAGRHLPPSGRVRRLPHGLGGLRRGRRGADGAARGAGRSRGGLPRRGWHLVGRQRAGPRADRYGDPRAPANHRPGPRERALVRALARRRPPARLRVVDRLAVAPRRRAGLHGSVEHLRFDQQPVRLRRGHAPHRAGQRPRVRHPRPAQPGRPRARRARAAREPERAPGDLRRRAGDDLRRRRDAADADRQPRVRRGDRLATHGGRVGPRVRRSVASTPSTTPTAAAFRPAMRRVRAAVGDRRHPRDRDAPPRRRVPDDPDACGSAPRRHAARLDQPVRPRRPAPRGAVPDRHHRAADARGEAPSGPEDGSRGHARRRHRSRLQQPPAGAAVDHPIGPAPGAGPGAREESRRGACAESSAAPR